jgi:hypothetical protein
VTAALSRGSAFKLDGRVHRSGLALITLRRELAARYVRIHRLWVRARNTYRRLNAAPVQDLHQLRAALQRLDRLDRGRAALRRDLKALSD